MIYKLLMICIVSLLVSGCRTTQPTSVNRLQIKVSQLERKVDNQEADIVALKSEMDELLMGGGEAGSGYEPFENPPQEIEVPQVEPATVTKEEDTRIIRVSASVQEVQTALKNAGYYDAAIDGKLGNKSKEAIRTFQQEHDLQVDGIVGPKTWNALKSYLGN